MTSADLHGSNHFLQGEEAGVDLLALESRLRIVVRDIDTPLASGEIDEAQLADAVALVVALSGILVGVI